MAVVGVGGVIHGGVGVGGGGGVGNGGGGGDVGVVRGVRVGGEIVLLYLGEDVCYLAPLLVGDVGVFGQMVHGAAGGGEGGWHLKGARAAVFVDLLLV